MIKLTEREFAKKLQDHTTWLETDGKSGERASFVGCDLTVFSFAAKYLPGADFTNADANHCDFTFANLAGCSFRNSNLRGAKFHRANTDAADFECARIEYTGLKPRRIAP